MPCFAYVGAEDNRKGIPFVKIVSLLCKLIQFLMGQCMKELKGKGDPGVVNKLLSQELNK